MTSVHTKETRINDSKNKCEDFKNDHLEPLMQGRDNPTAISKCVSSSAKRSIGLSLKTLKSVFDYGPSELNLYKYAAEESLSLWKDANEKLNVTDKCKPTDGVLLVHETGDNVAEDLVQLFDFEFDTEYEIAECELVKEKDIVCIFFLRETFWKTSNIEYQKILRDFIGNASKSCVFFMTASDADRDCAFEFCKKYKVCHHSHVISPDSEKSHFYDFFYDILRKDLKMFADELKGITETSLVGVFRDELKCLIAKLEYRHTTPILPLTEQCMDKIKKGAKCGIVGYRLCENKLIVFKDGDATIPDNKRKKIENSIKSLFKGTIQFIELKQFLTPHFEIECGGSIQNSKNSRTGTIGIFGMVKKANEDTCCYVALTSPHVISEGESASLSNGYEIGRCIWPPDEFIHNVSVIRINEDRIHSLQKTRFDKKIIIQEISNQILQNKKVFKYGAGTQTTEGWIAKIDNFELYGRNVMAILPKRSNAPNPFSDKGDSGAIVLTKRKGEFYAIGMIFGGDTVDYLAECISVQRESIAIFLKPALDDLRLKKGVNIEFDKI